MSEIKERTDFSEPRLVAATKSLVRWYDYETDRLNREVRLFNEELNRTDDPDKRAELQTALRQNTVEKRKLESNWANSSLRKRLTPGENAKQPAVIETRYFQEAPSRIESPRAASTNSQVKIVGLAAVFDRPSLNLGGWREKLAPGCFSDALKTSDVRCLQNHNSDLLLARSSNRSLRLYETGLGLKFYADLLDDDSVSEAVVARVKRKDLNGCSFSFTVAEDRWEFTEGQPDLKVVTKIDKLFDVGPVTFPAYLDTEVSVLVEPRQLTPSNDYDFLADQSEEDDRLIEELELKAAARKKLVNRGYLHAGRIKNRCKYSLENN